jgi:hypothetical protein
MGRVVYALTGAVATGAFVVACSLPLSGLGALDDGGSSDAGDASSDGSIVYDAPGPWEGAGGDATGSDGSGGEGGPAGTGVLASEGSIAGGTGLAMQTHLVYATHAALWWLFWVDSTQGQALQTSYSSDFATWTPGASLSLGGLSHDGQGGNFSVAYADLGGIDVVHVTIGAYGTQGPNDRHHLHVRASIAGTSLTFGAIDDVSDITSGLPTDPDGPATFVDSQASVWDASGWANYQGPGNEAAWQSANADQGSTWAAGFGLLQGIFVAAGTTHARAFASAGGALVALWDYADQSPPTNVGWSQFDGASWTQGATVFGAGSTQDPNDWDVDTLTDGHMHVVRRTSTGAFDHVRYDGVAWTALAAPPNDPLGAAIGSGVVILVNGVRLAVVTIAGDPAGSVREIVWDQTAWGAWTTLEGSTAARHYLSGWSGSRNDAVIWTQGSAGNYAIVGQVVSF